MIRRISAILGKHSGAGQDCTRHFSVPPLEYKNLTSYKKYRPEFGLNIQESYGKRPIAHLFQLLARRKMDLWHSWRFAGLKGVFYCNAKGALWGAGLGCFLSYMTLVVGDRIASDWTVVLSCLSLSTLLGLLFGSFIGTVMAAGYPLHKTLSFWAGILIMGSLWTLFVPPFWDKVLYPTATHFAFSSIGWSAWDWRIVQTVINANMAFLFPAGILADFAGPKWGAMQVGLIGASFIAIGYTIEVLVNSSGGKNMVVSILTAFLYAQGSAFANVAALYANLPRFGASTANWGTMSGIFQASFSLASTTWMLATWTFFGDAPSSKNSCLLVQTIEIFS